jgi:hypothetical protein
MAATTILAELNAMRVPPRPLKESAPALALRIRVQVLQASVERRMPRPK